MLDFLFIYYRFAQVKERDPVKIFRTLRNLDNYNLIQMRLPKPEIVRFVVSYLSKRSTKSRYVLVNCEVRIFQYVQE